MLKTDGYEPVIVEEGKVFILDQRKLPNDTVYIEAKEVLDICKAIEDMAVRGAPLIGITAAFGVYLAAFNLKKEDNADKVLFKAIECLSKTRPTAVNLFFALDRMKAVLSKKPNRDILLNIIKEEAFGIWNEQKASDLAISQLGSEYLKGRKNILTHCNTGTLATGGIGTALGIIKTMHKKDYLDSVFVDETRPYLQGMRLTAFELYKENIPYRIVTDNSCGILMKKGIVDAVVVGADRIAKNGDTANKVGTYCLAVLAKKHNIPFVVAAPESTIDRTIAAMEDIVVEERSESEVLDMYTSNLSPIDSKALNYSFDLTDHDLISAIVTEKNVYEGFEF